MYTYSTQMYRLLSYCQLPGDYRRKLLGAGQDAAFFDPENEEGRRKRRECSNAALDDLLQWLEHTEGQIAVYESFDRHAQKNIPSHCTYI